jgi:hypothetical protein
VVIRDGPGNTLGPLLGAGSVDNRISLCCPADGILAGAGLRETGRSGGRGQQPINCYFEFERTYFGRLRLAAQVITEAVPGLELVTDPR